MKNVWNFLMGAVAGMALITHPKVKEVVGELIEKVITKQSKSK